MLDTPITTAKAWVFFYAFIWALSLPPTIWMVFVCICRGIQIEKISLGMVMMMRIRPELPEIKIGLLPTVGSVGTNEDPIQIGKINDRSSRLLHMAGLVGFPLCIALLLSGGDDVGQALAFTSKSFWTGMTGPLSEAPALLRSYWSDYCQTPRLGLSHAAVTLAFMNGLFQLVLLAQPKDSECAGWAKVPFFAGVVIVFSLFFCWLIALVKVWL